jgi:hypothetical protein
MTTVTVGDKTLIEKEVLKALIAAEKLATNMNSLEMDYVCNGNDFSHLNMNKALSLTIAGRRVYLTRGVNQHGIVMEEELVKDDTIYFPNFESLSAEDKGFVLVALHHAARVLSNEFETKAQLNFEANCACLDIIRAFD